MNGSDPRQFGEIIFLKAGMRTPWCSLRYTKAGDWGKGSLCFSVVEAALEEHKWTDGFVHYVRTCGNKGKSFMSYFSGKGPLLAQLLAIGATGYNAK